MDQRHRLKAKVATLKKIASDQVREGMYLAKLDASWLNHPFWRGAFLVRRREEIEALRRSGISSVWIDTQRGVDVDDGAAGRIVVVDDIRIDEDSAPQAGELPAESSAQPIPRQSTSEEMLRARRIFSRSKPLLQSIFANARLGKSLDLVQAHELLDEISESLQRNPWALLSIIRLKTADDYTYLHSAAVGALMIALSRELGLPREQELAAGLAGMLHDIGKASIPNEILNKPRTLTEAEFDLVKTHPRQGHELLLAMGSPDSAVLDVCLHHHERLDGTGYPEGLSGERISQICRMASICDIYDATTSNRPYKAGWDPAESLRRMVRWTPAHLDQGIFHHFVKCIGIYPIGSFVRLESGRLGVVVDQTPASLLQPTVKAVFCCRREARIPPEVVELSAPACNDRIIGLEKPDRWGLPDPSLFLDVA